MTASRATPETRIVRRRHHVDGRSGDVAASGDGSAGEGSSTSSLSVTTVGAGPKSSVARADIGFAIASLAARARSTGVAYRSPGVLAMPLVTTSSSRAGNAALVSDGRGGGTVTWQ